MKLSCRPAAGGTVIRTLIFIFEGLLVYVR